MKFCTAILAVVAAASSGVSAFSPSAKGFVANDSGLMIPKQLQNKDGSLMTPNMVAGGAERAVGQEYYEGALQNRCALHCRAVPCHADLSILRYRYWYWYWYARGDGLLLKSTVVCYDGIVMV